MLAWGWELGPGLLGQSLFEWKSCSEVGFCPDACPDVLLMRKEEKELVISSLMSFWMFVQDMSNKNHTTTLGGSRVFSTFHSLRPLGQVYSPKCVVDYTQILCRAIDYSPQTHSLHL